MSDDRYSIGKCAAPGVGIITKLLAAFGDRPVSVLAAVLASPQIKKAMLDVVRHWTQRTALAELGKVFVGFRLEPTKWEGQSDFLRGVPLGYGYKGYATSLPFILWSVTECERGNHYMGMRYYGPLEGRKTHPAITSYMASPDLSYYFDGVFDLAAVDISPPCNYGWIAVILARGSEVIWDLYRSSRRPPLGYNPPYYYVATGKASNVRRAALQIRKAVKKESEDER